MPGSISTVRPACQDVHVSTLDGLPLHIVQRARDRAACIFGDKDQLAYLGCSTFQTIGVSVLEGASIEAGLADDGLESTFGDSFMLRNRNGDRGIGKLFLHDDMTPTLANLHEAMTLEDPAHSLAGQDRELTQR